MATGWWHGATNQPWTTTTNWYTTAAGTTNVTVVPSTLTDVANFTANGFAGPYNVYMNAAKSVLQVAINGTVTSGITILGGTSATPAANTLTLGASGVTMASGAGASVIGAVSGGTVLLASATSFPISNASANSLTLYNGITNTATSTVTFSATSTGNIDEQGVIAAGTGTTSVVVNSSGSGATILRGTNTFTGGFTLTAGTTRIAAAGALGPAAGVLTLNGGTLSSNSTTGYTVTAAGASTIGGNITLGDATNTGALTFANAFGLGAATRSLTIASDVSFNGIVSNGGITKLGSATLNLNGANTYTSGTTISAGTVVFTSTGLGTTGSITVNGGTLKWGTATTTDLSSRIVTQNSGTATFDVGANSVTFGSALTATTSALTFTGTTAGIATLSVANTFTGSVTVSAGTLSVTNATGLGSNTARAISVSSGATLSINAAVNNSSFSTTIAGSGAGTGSSLGAIAILTTSNISLGTITLPVNDATIYSTNTGSLTSAITIGAGRTLTIAGTAGRTFSGIIDGAGSLTVGFTGIVNTAQFLGGANTFTGNITLAFAGLNITSTGSLGTGASYAGNIALNSFNFNYQSSANQTLSGVISGSGNVIKSSGTTSVLTLTYDNTFSGQPLIQAGYIAVPKLTTAASNQPLGTNAQIQFSGTGLTTAGTLRYTGSTTSTDKVVYLASNSTGGAVIENNGTGALTITANLDGVSSASNRTLVLRGTYGATANEFSGGIANVGGGAGVTVLAIGFNSAPVQNSYWKLTGANTYTGTLFVFSGIADVTTAGSIGSPSSISVQSFTRNASLWVPGGLTYTGAIGTGGSTWGGDSVNDPLGAYRTMTAAGETTFSGAFSVGSGLTPAAVYADQSDLKFSGAMTGSGNTLVARAAAGRKVTLSGGIGTGLILFAMGPGTTVWTGTNATSSTPNLFGATLKVVLDGTNTFANTAFTLGALATTTAPSQRWAYTGGTLEFDNVGATGSVSKIWTGTTTVTRGPATIRLTRSAALGAISVRLTTVNTGDSLATVEYLDSAGGGVVGTDLILDVPTSGSQLATVNTWAPGLIISNGSALVPAAWTDSTGYVTFPVYGTTTNFTVQAASSSGFTVATGTTQNANVTGAVTGVPTTVLRTVRLDDATASLTLNSGQRLNTSLFMDMGTGAARTIASGGTLSSVGSNSVVHLYTANVTGTGATIASDLNKRNNGGYSFNGSGKYNLTGTVAFARAIQQNAGDITFASGSVLDGPIAQFYQSNPESGSLTATIASSTDSTLLTLVGGGPNTGVVLAGGDLTLTNLSPANAYYAGSVSRTGTQKLIIRNTGSTTGTQFFFGPYSVPVEMVRGQMSIVPPQGAVVSGAPDVTFSGNSTFNVDMNLLGGSVANAAYTATFGTVTAGGGVAIFAHFGSSNGTYLTATTLGSLVRSGDGLFYTSLSSSAAALNYITITSAPTLTNSVIGLWTQSGNFGPLTYRSGGTTFAGGGTVPAGGAIDRLAYGADANTANIFDGSPIPAASSTVNYTVGTTAITAQTDAEVYSVRLGVAGGLTVAAGNRLKTNAVYNALAGSVMAGADNTATLSTLDGDLYFYNATGSHSVKVTDNGATQTRVFLVCNITSVGLSNTANDYTGGTVITGGTLPATMTDAMFGASSGGLTFDGATFSPSANFTTSRSVTLTGAGVSLGHALGVTVALNGTLSGDGDLRLTSNGTTSITGSNTFLGATQIFSGILSISNDAALGTGEIDMAGGTLTLASGITSAFDPSSRFSGRGVTNYFVTNNSGNTLTFASSFGNASSFNKSGSSDIILTAANGITSGVGVSAGGALVVTNAFALGYGDTGGTATVASGASLVYRGALSLPATGASSATRTYSLSGAGYTAGGYLGALWADGGVVTVPGNISLGVAATIGTASGANGFLFTGLVVLGASRTLTVFSDGTGNVTFTGVISGTGTSGITKTGSEVLELAPAASSNTYAGATTVSAGTLLCTSEAPESIRPIPSGSAVTLAAGSTLQTATGTLQKGRLTVKSLDNSAGATIHIGGGTFIGASRAFTYAPTTDFGSATFSIALDPTLITSPGNYAMVYSPVSLTNYAGATASFISAPSFGYSSITVTPAGNGTVVNIGGTTYYAVVVTIA